MQDFILFSEDVRHSKERFFPEDDDFNTFLFEGESEPILESEIPLDFKPI